MEPIVVRHSEIADGRQCPLKHRLKWIDGWEPPGSSDASRLGSAIHHVLAVRYKVIQAQQTAIGYVPWARAVREKSADSATCLIEIDELTWGAVEDCRGMFELGIDHKGKDQNEVLRWIVEGYTEQYEVDPDWQVLLVEEDLRVPLSDRFTYSFHADLVVYDWSMKQVLDVDHKSTGQLLGQVDIDLSDQFGLYVWALTKMGYKHPVPVCNQIRTEKLKRAMVPEERFKRINSYRTKIEMANIAAETLDVVTFLYSPANLARPFSSPDPRTCDWKCEFRDTHIAMRKSKDGMAMAASILPARGFTVQKEKAY
jgi:PD-(D/E)XK nuclease superfamily